MENTAPGAPGIPPRWTTSAKDGIGTAINLASTVSFTLSHGILNEIYFPREDKAAIRDMGLIVTNGVDFFSEEKRNTNSKISQVAPGVPAFIVNSVCLDNRFEIKKQIVADPLRDTVLQRIEFKINKKDDYHIYALMAPHLNNMGANNTTWLADYKGHPMIFAQNNDVALAFACSVPWKKRSVGYVGISDGWQDLKQHKLLTWEYQRADNGNVAMIGEIDLENINGHFDLAIGFGANVSEAAHHALSSLMEGFECVQSKYIEEWKNWQAHLRPLHQTATELGGMFRLSAAVLRTHQSKNFPGAMIASQSIPWGNAMGDDNRSGYHLVWPRDLVECAGGLLALNANDDVLRVLNYLMATQEADGHWPQNMWVEGTPFWKGIQLDETALPILLIDLCLKQRVLDENHLQKYWTTVRKAASFLLSHGPITQQERWEEQSGISSFTIAATVAAMLATADFADNMGEPQIAEYCRQTADAWNDSIESWLYAKDTRLSNEIGVEGYYLRINPTQTPAADLGDATMQIKNKPDGENVMPITEMVSIDPLALVRFGLRSANDPRILNTIKVIDAKLKLETPHGDCWYRYVNDGYGEHEDGSAYNGTGIGRPWPLLSAERAHYEIAAGNIPRAKELLQSVENFSNNGLLPEQIWDADDITKKELFHGKHSGSAMPLVWAHAEYIKLVCSVKEQSVFDMPRHTQERYIKNKTVSDGAIWRVDLPISILPKGKFLRIETVFPALIKWTSNNWQNVNKNDTEDMGLGIHYIDLPTRELVNEKIEFTIFWKNKNEWAGENYLVEIV